MTQDAIAHAAMVPRSKRMHATRALLFGVPTIVLLASFAGVCVLVGSPWPWAFVIHEDGVRTLTGTIFYFAHATRELVPDAILGMAVAGSARYISPLNRNDTSAAAFRCGRRLAASAVTIIAVILVGTMATAGGRAVADNLAQLHTREGNPLSWGAHWRYHLVERLALILLAFSASALLLPRTASNRTAGRLTLLASSLAAFVVLTLVFRPTTEPFRDPIFLGHQLRELLTHALVTLPLAIGVCHELASKFSANDQRGPMLRRWPVVTSGLLSVTAGVFLLVASLLTEASSHGQAAGLARLLLPHVFEHALGYALVPTLTGSLYVGWSRVALRTSHFDR